MTRSPITREQITRLASKLEPLGPAFSERDREALHTVFQLAVSALSETAADAQTVVLPGGGISRDWGANAERTTEDDLPPLAEGFTEAFQPGLAAHFILENRTPEDEASRRPAITVRLV